MQVEEVLALEPEPGNIRRHMWVLSGGMPPKVHCWPKLQHVLAAQYAATATEVSCYSNVVLPSKKHRGIGTRQNILVL